MYTLYNFTNETWSVLKTFKSKEDFVLFLARAIKNNHRRSWGETCQYFDGLNLTMKDRKHIVRYEYERDVEGAIVFINGYPSIQIINEWQMYPYHVKDSEGRSVDIRQWMPEVLDIINNNAWPQATHKERQGRSYHRHARGRRILEIDNPCDFDDDAILTSSQMERLGIRPKRIQESKFCGGPYYSINGSGWKNHKNEKQWSAKQRRISDATYVGNISKREIAAMINDVEDDEELEMM